MQSFFASSGSIGCGLYALTAKVTGTLGRTVTQNPSQGCSPHGKAEPIPSATGIAASFNDRVTMQQPSVLPKDSRIIHDFITDLHLPLDRSGRTPSRVFSLGGFWDRAPCPRQAWYLGLSGLIDATAHGTAHGLWLSQVLRFQAAVKGRRQGLSPSTGARPSLSLPRAKMSGSAGRARSLQEI